MMWMLLIFPSIAFIVRISLTFSPFMCIFLGKGLPVVPPAKPILPPKKRGRPSKTLPATPLPNPNRVPPPPPSKQATKTRAARVPDMKATKKSKAPATPKQPKKARPSKVPRKSVIRSTVNKPPSSVKKLVPPRQKRTVTWVIFFSESYFFSALFTIYFLWKIREELILHHDYRHRLIDWLIDYLDFNTMSDWSIDWLDL